MTTNPISACCGAATERYTLVKEGDSVKCCKCQKPCHLAPSQKAEEGKEDKIFDLILKAVPYIAFLETYGDLVNRAKIDGVGLTILVSEITKLYD